MIEKFPNPWILNNVIHGSKKFQAKLNTHMHTQTHTLNTKEMKVVEHSYSSNRKEKKKTQINKLNCHLKKFREKYQNKPKVIRKKNTIKSRNCRN